jgi:chromosome segregation ATPase
VASSIPPPPTHPPPPSPSLPLCGCLVHRLLHLGLSQADKSSKALAVCQQALSEARERCGGLDAELRRLHGRHDALAEEHASLTAKAAELAVARQGLDNADSLRRDLQAQISTLQCKVEAGRGQELVALAKLATVTDDRDRAVAQSQALASAVEHAKAEAVRLQNDVDTCHRRIAGLQADLVAAADDVKACKDEVATAASAAVARDAALQEAKDAAGKYRDALERLGAVCEAQRGKCASLHTGHLPICFRVALCFPVANMRLPRAIDVRG